MSRVTPCHSPF